MTIAKIPHSRLNKRKHNYFMHSVSRWKLFV